MLSPFPIFLPRSHRFRVTSDTFTIKSASIVGNCLAIMQKQEKKTNRVDGSTTFHRCFTFFPIFFSLFTSISRNIWHVYHACGLRHLLWTIVCNGVLRHLLWQIPEQFFVASRKKIAILHFAPNTFLVFDPEAQVDGATPFPPRSMSTVDGAIQENVPSTLHSEYIEIFKCSE